jgi:hypothetical protein
MNILKTAPFIISIGIGCSQPLDETEGVIIDGLVEEFNEAHKDVLLFWVQTEGLADAKMDGRALTDGVHQVGEIINTLHENNAISHFSYGSDYGHYYYAGAAWGCNADLNKMRISLRAVEYDNEGNIKDLNGFTSGLLVHEAAHGVMQIFSCEASHDKAFKQGFSSYQEQVNYAFSHNDWAYGLEIPAQVLGRISVAETEERELLWDTYGEGISAQETYDYYYRAWFTDSFEEGDRPSNTCLNWVQDHTDNTESTLSWFDISFEENDLYLTEESFQEGLSLAYPYYYERRAQELEDFAENHELETQVIPEWAECPYST